jgi:hypothetical protein
MRCVLQHCLIMQVATDADIQEQMAGGRAFDLLDHSVLVQDRGAYRVPKKMTFGQFKALVSSGWIEM